MDLGATKTVIGSKLVPEVLNGLDPEIRKSVSRCPCSVTFRFGNHEILQSQQAVVVPIHGLLLKIAAVPGATPFLLSNTLLRALGATIDTTKHVLHATRISKSFPLNLTSKGLLLLDLNDPAQPALGSTHFPKLAETHATACDDADICADHRKTESAAAEKPSGHADQSTVSHSNAHTSSTHTQHTPTTPTNVSHEECTVVETEGQRSEIRSNVQTVDDSVYVQANAVGSNRQSSLRSKSVTRSFQVLPRHGHVDPCPASAEGAAAGHRARVRFQSSVDGTT